MRLRNIAGADDVIAKSSFVEHEPEKRRGHWREMFGNDKPLHIEIGMGKGRFITDMALQNPDISYIGIEKYSSVLLRAIEKRAPIVCDNLIFVRYNAEEILELFEEGEVDKIYLNFSDPWPKDRYAKRRLTSRQFLARYDKLLKRNGQIAFKTDNTDLFDFSLGEAEEMGWKLCEVTRDLHNSQYNEGNIMTEYEEKFSSKGNPICRLVAYRE